MPHPAVRRRVRAAVVALVAVLTVACAGPRMHGMRDPGSDVTRQVARIALSLRGAPYKFGGDGPGGFDCSGLVYYAYERAGLQVPRTARGQYDAIQRLYVRQLTPGDLVFFRTRGAFVSHVGIYVGDDRFVHALNAHEPVHVSSLDDDYWQRRLIGAGSLVH